MRGRRGYLNRLIVCNTSKTGVMKKNATATMVPTTPRLQTEVLCGCSCAAEEKLHLDANLGRPSLLRQALRFLPHSHPVRWLTSDTCAI